MPDLTDAIGYVRVSMKREEMISPELQRASQEQWARANGRRIVDWVTDLDATGRNFKRKVMGLIHRVEQGEVPEIIVWRYDRWGRNAAEALANVRRVELVGGSLVSATEPLDPETAIGKYNRTNAFALAELQSDNIGETWKAVRAHRIKDQLPPYGRPRFGYQRLGRVRDEDNPQRTRRDKSDPEPERYVPGPVIGQVLAAMYRDYIRGAGGPAIARRLNERGILNTYGRRWSGRTVLDVLDSGFGAGFLRLHSPSCRCKNAARCKDRVWIRGRHDPVVGEEEWEAYRRRRGEARDAAPRSLSPVYPVSALVRCGHCEGALVAGGEGRRRRLHFVCSRHRHTRDCPGAPSVALADLLAAVRAFLETIAADVDARAAVAKARAGAASTALADADKAARDLAAADRKLARLALRRAEDEDGILPDAAWEAAAAELKAERAACEKQLAAAQREASAVRADPLPVVPRILEGWDTLPAPALNQILRAVIRCVKVWKLAPATRDARGHFLPQEVRIRVVPLWEQDEQAGG